MKFICFVIGLYIGYLASEVYALKQDANTSDDRDTFWSNAASFMKNAEERLVLKSTPDEVLS